MTKIIVDLGFKLVKVVSFRKAIMWKLVPHCSSPLEKAVSMKPSPTSWEIQKVWMGGRGFGESSAAWKLSDLRH